MLARRPREAGPLLFRAERSQDDHIACVGRLGLTVALGCLARLPELFVELCSGAEKPRARGADRSLRECVQERNPALFGGRIVSDERKCLVARSLLEDAPLRRLSANVVRVRWATDVLLLRSRLGFEEVVEKARNRVVVEVE